MRLEEVLRMYTRTCARLDATPHLAKLAAIFKKGVQNSISAGMYLQWDTERLKEYADKLADKTVAFQDVVEELVSKYDVIEQNLRKLEACKPEKGMFRQILGEIQVSGGAGLTPWLLSGCNDFSVRV